MPSPSSKLDLGVRQFINGGYSVPKQLKRQVAAEAKRRGISPSGLVRQAILRDLGLLKS